jgi:hypothetical protein
MQNIEIDLETSGETTWFSDEEKVAIEKINFEFTQSNRIRGILRHISVFNDHHCYQSIKNKHQRKYKYRIDLSFLDPQPYRIVKSAKSWLYGSAGFALISAVMIYIGWFSGKITPSLFYDISLAIVILAMLISVLQYLHNSYDKIIFRSQYGRVKFIEVLNKYPNKNSFRKFVVRFMKQVKMEKAKRNFSQSKFLTRELQELRRLKNEEVISEREYESGKALIFKHKAFQAPASNTQ